MNSISNDVRNSIYDYLPMVNILELRRVSKTFTNAPVVMIFKQRLVVQIMRICDVTNADAVSLLAACAIRGGIISGSIILQVLTGDEWKSDIDIFVNDRPEMFDRIEFLSNVIGIDRESVYTPSCYIHDGISDLSRNMEHVHARDLRIPPMAVKSSYSVIYNYDWQSTNHSKYDNIQVIAIDRDLRLSHHDAVTEHFDMSIVSNSFFKNELEVWNLDKLISRDVSAFRCIMANRLEKYKRRGFNFKDRQHDSTVSRMSLSYADYFPQFDICKIPVTSREINQINKRS
jgi:hypothetical protein